MREPTFTSLEQGHGKTTDPDNSSYYFENIMRTDGISQCHQTFSLRVKVSFQILS